MRRRLRFRVASRKLAGGRRRFAAGRSSPFGCHAAAGDRAMSTAEAIELIGVLDRVKTWSPALRITLARRILETLEPSPPRGLHRGRPIAELIGIGSGEG